MNTRVHSLLIAAAGAILLCTAGCSKEGGAGASGGKRPAMAFPVEIQPVDERDVTYSITSVGSVDAYEVVQVTARVQGVIEQVRFAEGNRVRQGQTLVEIEPERYRLAVESARATLQKSEAAKAEAEAGLNRRETAQRSAPGLIPGEEIETWRTRVRTAEAEVLQAKAALDQAELNLRDAYVRAPVSGVVQTRTALTGQYVQAGSVLATMVRRDPLLLRFKIPEQDAPRIGTDSRAFFTVRNDTNEFNARIILVGAAAEQTSRMVSVTAVVDDPRQELLRPGSFAEVHIPVGSARNVPVIPQTAIRPSEKGFLAFVVEKNSARERIISIGMRTADGKVEVLNGLRKGELLVVRGAEALKDGVPVKVSGGKK